MITKVAQKLGWSAAILCGWLFFVLGFSAIPGFTHKVDVYFPPNQLLKDLPDGISIVTATAHRITLTSKRYDMALALYRAGARLLITSESNGCLDLRKELE
jgi:hypothetical protein